MSYLSISFANDSSDIFGRSPFLKQVQISPNGEKIAFLQEIKGKYQIVVKKIFDPKSKPVTFAFETAQLRELYWGNNEAVLFYMTLPYYSEGDFETFTMNRLGIFNVSDKEVIWPFSNRSFDNNIGAPQLVNRLTSDPEHVLISYYRDAGKRGRSDKIFKIRLSDGKRENVFKSYVTNTWVTNVEGDVLVYDKYDRKKKTSVWMYRKNLESEFQALKRENNGEQTAFNAKVLKVSESGKSIYYLKQNKKTIRTLFKSKIENNIVTDETVVLNFGDYDIDEVIRDPLSWTFAGVSHIENYLEYSYFEKGIAQVYADLKATFPNVGIRITSYSQDKNRFIVELSGGKHPQQYVYYDKIAGRLDMLGEGYPSIDKGNLGKVSAFDYRVSDGKTISGYFTKPTQTQTELPALIVMPHGGPEQRDDMNFDWMRQFFATQGFAVFQPNFRGSSGYGESFSKSGHGEWGKKMQSDLDEGVNKLISDKLVDQQRICIVGMSYGGYVAMYGATVKPELYKCAVSFGGISDLEAVYYHAEEQKRSTRYLLNSIGERDKKVLRKYSPYHIVSENTRPILLFHGDKDTVVSYYQSEKIYKKLEKLGVKGSKFFGLEGEDHWLSNGNSRKIFLRESLKFITENIQLKKNEAVLHEDK